MPISSVAFKDLLRYMFHLDAIMRLVVTRLDDAYAGKIEIPQDRVLYVALILLYKKNNALPSRSELSTYVKEVYLSQLVGGTLEANSQVLEVTSLIRFVTAPMDALDKERTAGIVNYVTDLYMTCFGKTVMQEAFDKAFLSPGAETFRDMSKALSEVTAKTAVVAEPKSALDATSTLSEPLIPTGINWFDQYIGGGLGSILAYGILIPSGCGKTTFASQLSISLALQGRKVALVMTEQSMRERQVVDRFRVQAFDTPIHEVVHWDHGVPSHIREDETKMAIWNAIEKNLKIYDSDSAPKSLEGLEAIASGSAYAEKPDVLILDWVGYFARKMQEASKRPIEDYTALRSTADKMAELAKAYNIPCILFHQVKGELAKSSPTRPIEHTEGEGCKTLCYNLAYGVGFGCHDPKGRTLINVSKHRYSGSGDGAATGDPYTGIVRFSKEKLRFESINNYKLVAGRFVKEGISGDTMPKAVGLPPGTIMLPKGSAADAFI